MRVYLRCRQIAVPQEKLNHAKIGTMIQEMGRKGMSKCVGREFTPDTEPLPRGAYFSDGKVLGDELNHLS